MIKPTEDGSDSTKHTRAEGDRVAHPLFREGGAVRVRPLRLI